MNEKARALDSVDELKFAREQGFFDKSLGISLLIGAIFLCGLFLILHFREVRVEVLELNSIAPSYIVAQTDFDFYDEEATIILKQEAVRDIDKIYRISEKEIRPMRTEFENFLLSDESWREKVNGGTFEEMFKGVSALENALVNIRFTDPRTLQKANEVKIPTADYILFTPPNTQLTISLPMQVWNQISRVAFSKEDLKPAVTKFIVQYFQPHTFSIEEDVPSERNLRRKIQGQISDKYTHVNAGSRIIDQGEKVNSRHIAMLQAMKGALNEKRNLWHPSTIAGSFILSVLLTVICAAFLYVNYPEVILSNRKLFLIVTVILITFGIAKVTEFFFLTSRGNLIEVIRYPLFVPFSAILLCCLLNVQIATFISILLTIILMLTLAFDRQGFLLMNLTASLVAILTARQLRQRKEIFIVCGKAWLSCVAVLVSLHLYLNSHFVGFPTDILSAGGFMLLTAILVVGMLPLLETGFRIMTDVTLMEYMDPNHDLLRRLSIEAPGTYQHSVVVGNLAEAAAQAIGANGLFCRAATLYHDVGKVTTPQYFTENQHGGMNIHQLLTPQESAQVIINHVSEGVSLGRKAGLPEQFIDIIKEHHGTTLVYYFYRKQLEKMGDDKSKVDESEFRYAGPKPRTKESVIIMIADSLEAASRSVDEINEDTIMDLTSRIIKEKAEEGQFDRALLTLEELATVKETLVKTLVAYGHSRIKYPTREVGEETLRDDLAS